MVIRGDQQQTGHVNPTIPGDRTSPSASLRTGAAARDTRPALITSRRSDAARDAVGPSTIRNMLQTGPGPRRRRLRLSSGALVGVALAGSIGAVTAVNATLFPSLGRPTTESVWQNPGKVPSTEAERTDPTTPRAGRTLVVDPTAPPVVSPASARALTTTRPASSNAPTTSIEVLPVPTPAGAKPAHSGSTSNSGTVTGTTIAAVPAVAPVAATGTKTGGGSSTSSPVATDDSSTSVPVARPATDPSTTDASMPTGTGGTAPGNTSDTSDTSDDGERDDDQSGDDQSGGGSSSGGGGSSSGGGGGNSGKGTGTGGG